MKKKIYVFISIIIFISTISSCESWKSIGKKKEAPDWVLAKPQEVLYYIGIGVARKKNKSIENYSQASKQNALSDLASEISIKIESKSILSVLETKDDISDNFTKDVKTQVTRHLEGYELVDTWEDKENYWTYYKLSKDKHRRIVHERKQKVLQDALGKYFNAQDLYSQKLHYNAFKLFAESLIVLKPYLGESLIVEINGKEQDLGNLIFKSIVDLISNVKIKESERIINVKRWVKIDNDLFSFSVVDNLNAPIKGLPIKIDFSAGGLLRNSEVTDNDGKVFCAISKIRSAPNNEILSVGLDVFAMTRQINDNVISSIIRKVPAVENKVRVIVEKPRLQILTINKQTIDDNSLMSLRDAFLSALSSDFIILDSNSLEKPDFSLLLNYNTKESGIEYNEYKILATYLFELKDRNLNLLYRKSKSNVFTSKESYADATNIAGNETSKTITRLIATEIISNINN